jgi:23S rRNA (uracil1939-C5)-methyltransferase
MDPHAPASPHRVGSRVELEVTGLTHSGDGVGRIDGQVCFVPGALPGETVRAKLRQITRHAWLAELEAVLLASPDRQRPSCILADRCGGCSLQHWTVTAQRRWKRELVRETMQRIGHLTAPLQPILSDPEGLGYRNRAIIPLRRQPDRTLRGGYFRRGSHRIVNMNHCPVLDPRLDGLIAPIKQDLDATGWPADCDATGEGGLRHLALRVGHGSGELLITLVSSHDRLPGLDRLAGSWMRRWPQLAGVVLNLQPFPTNTLMGEASRTLCGRGWLQERFAGLSLRIAADTFFQVNTVQAERVVPSLLQALSDRAPGRLIDAYCGIGTYSLPLARQGWQVHGLERNAEAVRLARLNATDNRLENRCRFDAVDVAAVLASELGGCEALLLDPPRKGLDAACMAAITALPPPRLLYLSCDPATLARDLRQLCGAAGYTIESLQPFDFFPQTTHVETLAVLSRSGAPG